MRPLERILLQRMEEQAEAEAARWRAESLAAAAGCPPCAECGRPVKQRAGTVCGLCVQKRRDAKRRPRSKRLCECGRRIMVAGEDSCSLCRARDSVPRMGAKTAEVLALAAESPITYREVQGVLQSSEVSARVMLSRLAKKGLLVREDWGLYRAVRP